MQTINSLRSILAITIALLAHIANAQQQACWSGTWTGTRSFTSLSCNFRETTAVTINISVANGVVSGNGFETGVYCYDPTTCAISGYGTDSGSLSGTVSSNFFDVTGSWVNSCNGQSYPIHMYGYLNGCTITGGTVLSLTRQSGCDSCMVTPIITWNSPAAITYGTPLSSSQLDATANVAGSFAYTPPSGTVLNVGTQTLSVVFTPTDTVDYTTATATASLVVLPATSTITLTANPATGGTVNGGGSYAIGSQVQISATAAMNWIFTRWNDANTDNPRTITVPPGGATYTATFNPTPVITFYHQPGDNANGSGHAFLSLKWENGDTQFYGFYSTSWENEILGVTPGIVDGGEPNWDFNISYPITVVQYDAAATVITQDRIRPPIYSLLTFNCMGWAASIANAAGIQLPPYMNMAGVADPSTFGASLKNIGNGNKYDGGLVTGNGPPDPPTPFDYSYGGLEVVGHTNAASLATSLGLAYDYANLGTVNANNINGISLNLIGATTNQDLISMNWADGSVFQGQSLAFSHIYSAGTYPADLLVIDAGAVHSYHMTVVVSSSGAVSNTVNVSPFPPASIPNQGIVPANPVPDFNVIQTTSISLLPNGHAVIGFVGVPTWTYTIQATSNLTQEFMAVGSATAGSNGMFQFNDPAAVNAKSRFYRASYP